MSESNFRGVDLFCGCGGVTSGFIDAGIAVGLGVDWEPAYKQTYESNNKIPYECGDIRKLKGSDILAKASISKGDKLIISSCSPCQPFSLKNSKRTNDGKEDYRADLGLEVLRIIEELRSEDLSPEGLFLENVPDFAKSPAWNEIRRGLFRLGYSVAHRVVNCTEYGVPQNRRRFIAIATRAWKFLDFPRPTHGPGLLPVATVRQVFGGLSSIDAGGECKETPNHRARALSAINLARIQSVPLDGGSRTAFPEGLILDCHRNFDGHKDVYGRMKFDEPSPTITTRCISITNGRYGHPVEDRAITIREAARLQTFPDNFIFKGSSLDINARMVGNAVPVKIAQVFGRHLIALIENAPSAQSLKAELVG